MEQLSKNLTTKYVVIYYCAERSFGDISAATMFQDMDKLIVGIVLMFVYMQVVLSKYSWVELRVSLLLNLQLNLIFIVHLISVDAGEHGTLQCRHGLCLCLWNLFPNGCQIWSYTHVLTFLIDGSRR